MRVAFVLGIVLVSRPIFAEEGPPVIQTTGKDAIAGEPSNPEPQIERKTEQKAPQTIIKKVEISPNGMITIYYYGIDETHSPPVSSEEDGASDNTDRTTNEQIAWKIMHDFHEAWWSVDDPNQLSLKQLETADALAQEYYRFATEHPELVTMEAINNLSAKGNRYILLAENLIEQRGLEYTLDYEIAISATTSYLTSCLGRCVREEDVPTSQEKYLAIEKFTTLITEWREQFERPAQLELPARDEIKKIHPQAWLIIKDKIYHDESDDT